MCSQTPFSRSFHVSTSESCHDLWIPVRAQSYLYITCRSFRCPLCTQTYLNVHFLQRVVHEDSSIFQKSVTRAVLMVTHRIKSNWNTGFCTISWEFPFPSFDRSPKRLLSVSSSALSVVFSDESLLNDIVGRITKEGSSESPFRSICTKFTRTICLYYRLYINIYNIYKYI